MCGGHGSYRILGHLIDETLYEHSRSMGREEQWRDERAEIEGEVKILYARGEIDSGTYHRLIELAQTGQLSWDDLKRIGGKPPLTRTPERHTSQKRDAEIVNSLNQLYTHRKRLVEAREETQNVLQSLEKEAARLNEQAQVAQEKAQQAIVDEDVARAYLHTRQEAMDRASTLKERIDELRQNLHRIENLEADLSTREAELKALESGEQLAKLESDIRQNLLNNSR